MLQLHSQHSAKIGWKISRHLTTKNSTQESALQMMILWFNSCIAEINHPLWKHLITVLHVSVLCYLLINRSRV